MKILRIITFTDKYIKTDGADFCFYTPSHFPSFYLSHLVVLVFANLLFSVVTVITFAQTLICICCLLETVCLVSFICPSLSPRFGLVVFSWALSSSHLWLHMSSDDVPKHLLIGFFAVVVVFLSLYLCCLLYVGGHVLARAWGFCCSYVWLQELFAGICGFGCWCRLAVFVPCLVSLKGIHHTSGGVLVKWQSTLKSTMWLW